MHFQRLAAALLVFVPLYACPLTTSNTSERDKTIWSYDGGVLLHTCISLFGTAMVDSKIG